MSFVIEVKRNFSAYYYHENDLEQLKHFCENVLLIIFESSDKIETIQKREEILKKKGYTDVFHFVRWENDNSYPLLDSWHGLMMFASEQRSCMK